jgi:hypothetical protein
LPATGAMFGKAPNLLHSPGRKLKRRENGLRAKGRHRGLDGQISRLHRRPDGIERADESLAESTYASVHFADRIEAPEHVRRRVAAKVPDCP